MGSLKVTGLTMIVANIFIASVVISKGDIPYISGGSILIGIILTAVAYLEESKS